MKQIIKILLLGVFLYIGFTLQVTSAEAPTPPPLPPTTQELALKFSRQFGNDPNQVLKVAKCESGLKQSAINYNDGGKGKHSIGIMQFQVATFDGWEKKLGEDLNIESE